MTLLVPNSNFYVDEGNFIKFELFDLINAPSVKPSNSFKLTFYEFDDVIMSVGSGVYVTAKSGQL